MPTMSTLVCVPIMLEFPAAHDPSGGASSGDAQGLAGAIDAALADAALAKSKSADLVEFRIDAVFDGAEHGPDADELDAYTVAEFRRLLAESPLPVILTCRPTWEGGEYDGDDSDRVALFEKLCCDTEHPPAYLDVELVAYTRSANLRQKINLCVTHPKQQRGGVTTRLILSTHDFEGRPADLDRRLLAMYDEPACAVVKVAFRARSLRDNLNLFEILRESPKPTIALGMGEFGLMSRVLAPKFNGFLTFASLRDQAATAPGQPTIDDLLGMYRFRSIGKATKLYGVIGWPVGHSLSPLIHNAGFEQIGWDGVYLPLPIAADEQDAEASFTSFKATLESLLEETPLELRGTSVTLPHKQSLHRLSEIAGWLEPSPLNAIGAMNTLAVRSENEEQPIIATNTDALAIEELITPFAEKTAPHVHVFGAGGVARAAAFAAGGSARHTYIHNRTPDRARTLAEELPFEASALPAEIERGTPAGGVYINCTSVGMAGGPAPEGSPVAIDHLDFSVSTEPTIFFDTVYNPVETPMLKAARERGCRTIDGVEMFVRQAAAQFRLWTGQPAPIELFDRLCRERLSASEPPAP